MPPTQSTEPGTQGENVFVSWSGTASRVVAEELKRLIPLVVHSAKTWMSPDIPKGTIPPTKIVEGISIALCGVVVVNSENLEAPWLNWEAGALMRVTTGEGALALACGVTIPPNHPLSAFQYTIEEKDDIRRMMKQIAKLTGHPDIDQVDIHFETYWPQIDKAVRARPTAGARDTRSRMEKNVDSILETLTALRRDVGERSPGQLARDLVPLEVHQGGGGGHSVYFTFTPEAHAQAMVIQSEHPVEFKDALGRLRDIMTPWAAFPGAKHIRFTTARNPDPPKQLRPGMRVSGEALITQVEFVPNPTPT